MNLQFRIFFQLNYNINAFIPAILLSRSEKTLLRERSSEIPKKQLAGGLFVAVKNPIPAQTLEIPEEFKFTRNLSIAISGEIITANINLSPIYADSIDKLNGLILYPRRNYAGKGFASAAISTRRVTLLSS